MKKHPYKKIKYRHPVTQADDIRSAFNVIEVLVLLLILSVISVALTARLSRADSEKRLTQLVDTLQVVRGRIEFYRVSNNGLLPGQKEPGGDICEADFAAAITSESASGRPYLKEVPKNPFNGLKTVKCVNGPEALPGGTEGTGWWINAATGRFGACDSAFHAAY